MTGFPARTPTIDPAAAGLAAWLAARSDDELVALLRRRPDLTTAPPKSSAVLATRALGRMSVHRAADQLDTGAFGALEALIALSADVQPVPVARVREILAHRAAAADVDAGLGGLRALALAWGETEIKLAPAAREILPWQVGLLTDPSRPDPADPAVLAATREEIAGLEPDLRALLDTLARGPGVGRTRDAGPAAPADRPVPRLLAAGLLDRVDDQTVRLPEPVRAVLTGTPAGVSLARPRPTETVADPAEVDAAGAGAALETLGRMRTLLRRLGTEPAPELRTGGVGVRELGRLAKSLDWPVDRVSLLLEIASAARLIGAGRPEPAPADDTGETYQAPTSGADEWLGGDDDAARWALLARAWLALPRAPHLIGAKDDTGRPVPALDPHADPATVVFDRRAVLTVLAGLQPGHGLAADQLPELLRWRRPRRHARLPEQTVTAVLSEAAALGLVARGALTEPGRLLITDHDPYAAMAAALPEPVDHVLLQADLTMIVPGPPIAELAARLDLLGEVESTGPATVYRIGEHTLRAAMDAGYGAEELHGVFAEISRTPVPQSLTFMIDDVARRHGRLRVGYAGCFLRADDPAVLAETLTAVPELGLRTIAPTVAVSPLELALVLDRLAEAGVAAVGEDASGAVIDLRPPPARVPTPRRTRTAVHRPDPGRADDTALREVVAALRAADRIARATATDGEAGGAAVRAGGAQAMELLTRAARLGRAVALEHVDAAGKVRHRIVEPVGITAGVLSARDPVTDAAVEVALHRITTVTLVD